MSYNFVPGTYRVKVLRLNVRGTKDWNTKGNLVGVQLTMGKEFPVYDVEVDDHGYPWGVITPPEAPQAHYVCLWDGNRLFATLVQPTAPRSPVSEWMLELDAWARSQGYNGIKPF